MPHPKTQLCGNQLPAQGMVLFCCCTIHVPLARAPCQPPSFVQGMESFCVRGFAEALEVVPYTLAENAGLNPIQIVTQLRAMHAAGERAAGGAGCFACDGMSALVLALGAGKRSRVCVTCWGFGAGAVEVGAWKQVSGILLGMAHAAAASRFHGRLFTLPTSCKHPCAGINVKKGSITNMLEENVVQPLLVTSSAITLATECVRMILKIDDIVPTR